MEDMSLYVITTIVIRKKYAKNEGKQNGNKKQHTNRRKRRRKGNETRKNSKERIRLNKLQNNNK
jgi:hypothetical protein